ncbi:hypothetical protein J5834_03945, partial [bacterium]|nr:hypothetical protein [bacterium]
MILRTANEFRSHISYYLVIRFFFILAVLFSFFFFPLISDNAGVFSGTSKLFLILTFVLFAINVISLLFVRSMRESMLIPFACIQFLLEISY